MTYFLLFLGFLFLIKGADILVDGASIIAKRFHISKLIIGFTIVAFGSSAPEMMVSIFAAIHNSPEIAFNNIFGSNIANILLVLSASALILPLPITRDTRYYQLPFALFSLFLLAAFSQNGTLGRLEGIILLIIFGSFLIHLFRTAKKEKIKYETHDHKLHTAIFYVILGLTGLKFGGDFVVTSAITIAHTFHLSEAVIAATIVALGTSLPELAATIIAVLKKQTDLAIGTITGSIIFNTLWVLGLASIISPLHFTVFTDLWVNIAVTAALCLITITHKKIGRISASIGLIGYIFYITLQFL